MIAAKKLIKTWTEHLRSAIFNIFQDDDPPSESAFEEAILNIESNMIKVESILGLRKAGNH